MTSWSQSDRRHMSTAVALSRRPPGRVSPNPRVGAVVVRGNRVLASGFHRGPGTAHAEALALSRAGARAAGATLYVTLEPCAHWGRTPPCTDAILASGVRRVIYATGDPDVRVNGRGRRILRRAGVTVSSGLLAREAREVNRAYFHRQERGRPWVTLKLAMTLDGRIADGGGRSRWITGVESRRLVHTLRRQADLVLVGRGTVEADDPQLDVRLSRGGKGSRGDSDSPLRMVVDSRLRADPGLRFFAARDAARTMVATTPAAPAARAKVLEARGLRVWRVRAMRDGRVDLAHLLRRMGQDGITSVLVEGGSELASALLAADLADEVVLFHAPLLLGSGDTLNAIGDIGVPALDRAIRFEHGRWRRIGEDAVFTGRPVRR